MLNTYIVEGGVGKCVAFTALTPKLKEKSEVQIHTPYVQCFANNPDVKLGFDSISIPLGDARIMASDNICYSEPYKSNFQFGKEHIIESYCKLHNVEYDKSMKPKLYTEHLKESVDKWLEEKKIEKYILVQFSGGQPNAGFNPNNQYTNINPNRNYQPFLAQQVINMLKEEYKDTTIIDCTLPNEPSYFNTIKCDLHWSQIHELLKNAEGFVCIDSCLNHFSPSANKSGVVIWGSTRWTQFGYKQNTNLQFHMKDKWNETKFVDSDPRNNMVEPKLIIDEYKKIKKNKKITNKKNN